MSKPPTSEAGSVRIPMNLSQTLKKIQRIADRVTNIAEDLVFLDSGAIEELG